MLYVFHISLCLWQCSTNCGYGTQERMVVCQLYDGSTGDTKLCSEPAPNNKQQCVLGPCGRAQWNTTSWSKVSKYYI